MPTLSYNLFLLECLQVTRYCQSLQLLNDRIKHDEKWALSSQEILRIFNIILIYTWTSLHMVKADTGKNKKWAVLLKWKECGPVNMKTIILFFFSVRVCGFFVCIFWGVCGFCFSSSERHWTFLLKCVSLLWA